GIRPFRSALRLGPNIPLSLCPRPGTCSSTPKICSLEPWTEKAPAIKGRGAAAPSSRVIPVSLLIEHDGFIHFDERPHDHRLRQSVPLQYPIIDHQHFELCKRCLPKALVSPCPLPGGVGEILHRLLVDRTWLHLIPGMHRGQLFHFLVAQKSGGRLEYER